MPLRIHFTDPEIWPSDGWASPAEGTPILFHDGDEWTVMLDDGTVVNDTSVRNDPTPVNYRPLVALLAEVAHTLNVVDSSDDACREVQALLSDNMLVVAPASGGVVMNPPSYVPMREMRVTLIVHVPVGEPDPDEWDWPDLTDMSDDDIQFGDQRVIRSYNRESD